MSEAPRLTQRLFPDAAQLGIATGVVINQSRVTFTGQRGMVLLSYRLRLENAAAVAIAEAGLSHNGSAVFFSVLSDASIWFEATAAIAGVVTRVYVFVDPAAGSFFELQIVLTGGTVNVNANAGRVTALSFEPGTETGPIVTIS